MEIKWRKEKEQSWLSGGLLVFKGGYDAYTKQVKGNFLWDVTA